jgi:SAM-dependent methyltransferase
MEGKVKKLGIRDRVHEALAPLGFDNSSWARKVMYRELDRWLRDLGPERQDVVEVSGEGPWKGLPWRSYRSLHYPDFDLCQQALSTPVDLIIADQVFEHLLWPYRAARHAWQSLRPGGRLLVATPFLIRVHENPTDCSRWTETGLRHLLAEAGFPLELMQSGSWGNRAVVSAYLSSWAKVGFFGSMANEKNFPIVVWVMAQRGP